MAPEPDEREPLEPEEPTPDLRQALSTLSNRELLSTLDLTLLELERRLYRYAHEGEELIYMADEGLLLASRAGARLGQALSAAEHAEAHLQVVGVGEWHPTSTHPSWDDEPRLTEEELAVDHASLARSLPRPQPGDGLALCGGPGLAGAAAKGRPARPATHRPGARHRRLAGGAGRWCSPDRGPA